MEFLDIWDREAEKVAAYKPDLYEQSFVNYVLRKKGTWWNKFIELQPEFKKNRIYWRDQPLAKLNPTVWSVLALRGRLVTTDSTCALTMYDSSILYTRARIPQWGKGDVINHFAGTRGEEKFNRINAVIAGYDMTTVMNSTTTASNGNLPSYFGLDAAAAYLQLNLSYDLI
jgi:hypothetical protein